MRNLIMESLDVKYSHHRCEYCSNTDWYWCYNLQYLRDLKEIKYLMGICKHWLNDCAQ